MIKSRIIQLIENKKLPKELFYSKIGMTSASFRGKARLTPINSSAIENILSEVPDLSLEWLITGKGEMLKKAILTIEDSPNPLRDKIILRQDQLIDKLEEENKFLKNQLSELKKAQENTSDYGMVAESKSKLKDK